MRLELYMWIDTRLYVITIFPEYFIGLSLRNIHYRRKIPLGMIV